MTLAQRAQDVLRWLRLDAAGAARPAASLRALAELSAHMPMIPLTHHRRQARIPAGLPPGCGPIKRL